MLLIHSFHTKARLLLLYNHDNYTELEALISPILVSEKEMEKKAANEEGIKKKAERYK